MKLLFIKSLLLMGFFLVGCINSQNYPQLKYSEKDIKEIDKVVKTLYENEQFSGSVLVAVKGKIIYQSSVGFANITDSIPNTKNTKFRIASFTKPFTVMLILQLMEEGLIELDGKLTDYLPEFKVDGGEEITIYQLLKHRAGITGHPRIPNLLDIEKLHYTRKELLELIKSYDLIAEPGKTYEYSNFGFTLLGLVIEKVTGKSYDEVLNEKICIPAGMKNTHSDITAEEIENRAIGYTYNYFTGPEKAPYLDMSFCFGAGQLLSTVYDLFLFDQALYTDKLLSKNSKELFFNKLGWRFVSYPFGKSNRKIWCNNLEGSINGFQSHTQRIKKDSVLIVALRNIKEAVYENEIVIKWPNAIASPILSILYGEEYEIVKKSGAFEIFNTLIHSGKNEAEKRISEIVNRLRDKYYFNDKEFEFFEKELRNNSMANLAEELKEIHLK